LIPLRLIGVDLMKNSFESLCDDEEKMLICFFMYLSVDRKTFRQFIKKNVFPSLNAVSIYTSADYIAVQQLCERAVEGHSR
jgi:hypothetical protein